MWISSNQLRRRVEVSVDESSMQFTDDRGPFRCDIGKRTDVQHDAIVGMGWLKALDSEAMHKYSKRIDIDWKRATFLGRGALTHLVGVITRLGHLQQQPRHPPVAPRVVTQGTYRIISGGIHQPWATRAITWFGRLNEQASLNQSSDVLTDGVVIEAEKFGQLGNPYWPIGRHDMPEDPRPRRITQGTRKLLDLFRGRSRHTFNVSA